jgi:hypothetical protein
LLVDQGADPGHAVSTVSDRHRQISENTTRVMQPRTQGSGKVRP